MSNKKKILLGVAFTLDAALTIALFVISIIMLVTMPKTQTDFIIAQQTPGLIPYLQTHSTIYLVSCVLPLDLLVKGKTFRPDFRHHFRDSGVYHLPHFVYLV